MTLSLELTATLEETLNRLFEFANRNAWYSEWDARRSVAVFQETADDLPRTGETLYRTLFKIRVTPTAAGTRIDVRPRYRHWIVVGIAPWMVLALLSLMLFPLVSASGRADLPFLVTLLLGWLVLNAFP